MSSFSDSFWGEKNNGFDVLYHNMKYGVTSGKELSDFLRESCTVEETYSKLLGKLAKQASNYSHQGTFSPFWQVLKTLTEKLSVLHFEILQPWQELIKEVQKYTETQNKRHKSVKDSESGTQDVVQSIQQTTAALHKARETYHARCLEFERLKRENATPKEVEKAEAKFKKASDEYKTYVEKYATIRDDFERRMSDSCRNFQELEEAHLKQMKDFINTYARTLEEQYSKIGQVHGEFRSGCNELSEERLICMFIEAKTTGTDKPGPIEFEEPDLSNLPPPNASPEIQDKNRDSVEKEKQKKEGLFNKSKKEKTKKTKKKKKEKKSEDPEDEQNEQNEHNANKTPEVDEEGFSIRPENPVHNEQDRNSWFSSTDDESDQEEKRKIKVEIKPISPNGTTPVTANVDDIRASMGNLRLSPTASKRRSVPTSSSDNGMKRSYSVSETMHAKKPNSVVDLLDIDFDASSSASTPTGGNYSFPSPLVPNSGSNATTPGQSASTNDPFVVNLGEPLTNLVNNDKWNTSDLFPEDHRTPSPRKGGADPFIVNKDDPFVVKKDLTPVAIQNNNDTKASWNKKAHFLGHRHHSSPSLKSPIKLFANDPFVVNTDNNSPALPAKQNRATTPTSTLSSVSSSSSLTSSGGAPLLPGPPPRPAPRTKTPVSFVPRPAGRNSPAPSNAINRTDSAGSLSSATFNTTSMPVGSSRGPSPLTIGMSDTIPLAIAFTETVNAYFKGSDEERCLVKIGGVMMVSFPAGIVKVLMDNPSPSVLSFRVKNTSKLEQVVVNRQLVSQEPTDSSNSSCLYSFNMTALSEHLKKQSEINKSASYFNIDILKYQVKTSPGVQSTPLQLVTYWKCEPSTTDFRLDYHYNAAAMSKAVPLSNINVVVPLEGDVTQMQSMPTGVWSKENKRATWKINEVSEATEQSGSDCIRAKFELASGPTSPSTVAVQFACEGQTLSGVDFELSGMGYRLSLAKKRFVTGKYVADTDTDVRYV